MEIAEDLEIDKEKKILSEKKEREGRGERALTYYYSTSTSSAYVLSSYFIFFTAPFSTL